MLDILSKTQLVAIFLIFFLICSSCSIPPDTSQNSAHLEKVSEPTGSVLVVIAHQDDEAFIVSRLKRHIEIGDMVSVIWTSSSYTFGERYAEKRIAEAQAAMSFLGVKSSNYFFLNYPDGSTHHSIKQIINKLEIFILRIKPDLIYVPAYEIGHIDHDVVNFSTVVALNNLNYNCSVFEFPIYNAFGVSILPFRMRNIPPGQSFEIRNLDEDEFQYVVAYWNFYESQHFPLGFYIHITDGLEKTFGREYLRKIPKYNYTAKPFKAQAAYERFLKNVSFVDFADAVRKITVKERRQNEGS
jgi:hypothetical protein